MTVIAHYQQASQNERHCSVDVPDGATRSDIETAIWREHWDEMIKPGTQLVCWYPDSSGGDRRQSCDLYGIKDGRLSSGNTPGYDPEMPYYYVIRKMVSDGHGTRKQGRRVSIELEIPEGVRAQFPELGRKRIATIHVDRYGKTVVRVG